MLTVHIIVAVSAGVWTARVKRRWVTAVNSVSLGLSAYPICCRLLIWFAEGDTVSLKWRRAPAQLFDKGCLKPHIGTEKEGDGSRILNFDSVICFLAVNKSFILWLTVTSWRRVAMTLLTITHKAKAVVQYRTLTIPITIWALNMILCLVNLSHFCGLILHKVIRYNTKSSLIVCRSPYS